MPSKSELQNLLRKMGGTPESGDSVDETIKKITEVYEPGGGGSGLPEGGSAGQILKKKSSAEGDAEWADESCGGSGLKVTCTKVNNQITADKTYEDIVEALANGINVFAVLDNQVYSLCYINEQESNGDIQFAYYEHKKLAGLVKHIMSKLIFKSDGSIAKSINEQPAVPSEDFMQRVNDLGLMPSICFNFQYFQADDSLEYINMQGSGEKLDYFLTTGYGSIVFLTVGVINNSGGLDHSDVYWCQKAWPDQEENDGHFIFSRTRVGVNPNTIYVDEVEVTYSLTYSTLKSVEARTVEIAASTTSSIY